MKNVLTSIVVLALVTRGLSLPRKNTPHRDHNNHNALSEGLKASLDNEGQQPAVSEPKHSQQKTAKATEEPWRVCYFDNWSQYRPEPVTYWPEDIPVSLCSHIYYAFSTMEGNDLAFFEVNDDDLYRRVIAKKQENPNLKIVLAVGGWTFGTSKMTLMFSSQENRTEFIGNVISRLRAYGFDGIDFDFEYPGDRGSPPEDKYLFTCFLDEIKTAFVNEAFITGNTRLLLTVGVAAGSDRIISGYEIAAISRLVDKVNLMSYDFFGGFYDTLNPNAPLYSRPNMNDWEKLQNVHDSAQTWINGGCPRNKLILGVPAYGRGCTILFESENQLGDRCYGPSRMLNYSLTDGTADHFEVCKYIVPNIANGGTYSPYHRIPYGNVGNQWFSFENTQSMQEKIQYIIDEQLAGFMFWTLSKDDWTGLFCNEQTYPLLRAANNLFLYYQVPIPEDPVPDANFCIGKPSGVYENSEDCSTFYRCLSGQTSIEICSEGTLYDDIFKGCRSQNEMNQTAVCVRCHAQCTGCAECAYSLVGGNC